MASFSQHKKRNVSIIAVALVLSISGAAYAYWTAGGSGTGSAATGTNAPISAVQTTAPTAMAPGDTAQSLAGKFNNQNSGPVYVATVTASITSVFSGGVAAVGCDATDYTLAGAVMTVNAEVPSGTAQGAWTGATIKFNNKTGSNQDACKNAVVNLAYTIG